MTTSEIFLGLIDKKNVHCVIYGSAGNKKKKLNGLIKRRDEM